MEDGTRASAVEVILSLTVEMPAPVRKAAETASLFFPSLIKMLMEVEKDDETWINSAEEEDISATGPSSTAIDALKRISVDLGEKTTLAIIQPMIGQCSVSENWVEKQAGFMMMGLIAESCQGSIRKNLDSSIMFACKGLQETNMRVKHASLFAMTNLFEILAP